MVPAQVEAKSARKREGYPASAASSKCRRLDLRTAAATRRRHEHERISIERVPAAFASSHGSAMDVDEAGAHLQQRVPRRLCLLARVPRLLHLLHRDSAACLLNEYNGAFDPTHASACTTPLIMQKAPCTSKSELLQEAAARASSAIARRLRVNAPWRRWNGGAGGGGVESRLAALAEEQAAAPRWRRWRRDDGRRAYELAISERIKQEATTRMRA